MVFGILKSVVDEASEFVSDPVGKTVRTAENVVDGAKQKAQDFIDDPVGETVNHLTKPIQDAAEIIDGLSEGELREKAILSLGADVASGMALSELIEWYQG